MANIGHINRTYSCSSPIIYQILAITKRYNYAIYN